MYIFGIFAFLGSVVLSRILNERAFKSLSDEQKLKLIEEFSGIRKYSLIPLVILAAIYFVMLSQDILDSNFLTAAFYLLVGFYIVAKMIWNQMKLRQLDLPAQYVRQFLIVQTVAMSGFVILIISVVWLLNR